MEIWKDIKGYEGYYQISSKGNVRNIKTNYIKIITITTYYINPNTPINIYKLFK